MKNELQKYIDEPYELINKDRWKIRETIIQLLKTDYEFSDQEYDFILKNYSCDYITNYFPLNKTLIKKWVEHGLSINRFPKSVYKDEEITEYILNHADCINRLLIENVTPNIVIRYAQNHSDYDLYRIHTLCTQISKYKDEIAKLENDKEYSQRLKDGEESFNKNTNCFMTSERWNKHEDELKDNCKVNYLAFKINQELKKELTFAGSVEQINIDNEVLVNPKKSMPKREQDFTLWNEKNNSYVFHYISDLHLTHKIRLLLEKGVDRRTAIEKTVMSAVNDIVKSIDKVNDCYIPLSAFSVDILLIAGDISYDYDINSFFFSALREKLKYKSIYVVLGNHELWNGDPEGSQDIDMKEVIKKYETMLQDRNIELLNNKVIMFYGYHILEYTFNELVSKKKEIKDAFRNCSFSMFGSIGFSGLNEKFNAQNGIYRGALKDIETEKMLSQQVSDAFDNLLELRNNTPIVCLTHMPYTDWYSGNRNLSNCYFVSGHTHSNYYSLENPIMYSDNQVGYNGKKYNTKQFFFDVRKDIDIFENLNDGIHEIHYVDYLEYLRYKRLHVPYATVFEKLKIFLIRKNNISMFVTQSDKGKLAILNGGKRKNLNISDINYYYDNMDKVGDIILNTSKKYSNYVQSISKEVKKIGGDGEIHGCIVDLDFNNKIYINPLDGKITAYCVPYVYSTERILYESVYKLLQENPSNSENIEKMRKNIEKKGNSLLMTENDGDKFHLKSNDYEFSNAYRMSYTMKKIQSLIEDGILKIWPDELDVGNKKISHK